MAISVVSRRYPCPGNKHGDINGQKNELQSNGTGVKVGRAKYFPASTGE